MLVAVDPAYYRPTEVDLLLGDATKAHTTLGWRHRTNFKQIVEEMVRADRRALRLRAAKAEVDVYAAE